jgi:hypothetical protein
VHSEIEVDYDSCFLPLLKLLGSVARQSSYISTLFATTADAS